MPVREPTRLTVLKSLCAELEKIEGLEGAVFRGRNGVEESDPLPMLSILEDPTRMQTPLQGEAARARIVRLPLVIEGYVDDDPANPTDPASYLLQSVIDRLGELKEMRRVHDGRPYQPNLLGLGSTVRRIDVGTGSVLPPIAFVSHKAFFQLQIEIEFAD